MIKNIGFFIRSNSLHILKKYNTRFSTKRIMLSESNNERIIQALDKIHEQKISKMSIITENEDVSKNIPGYLLESEVLDLKIYKKGETVLNNIDIGHKLLSIGEIDGMVSCNILPTKDLIKSALKYIGLKENYSTLSSYFIMIPPSNVQKTLLFADCAVVKKPTEEQLIDIILQTAESYRKLFEEDPKIALLSYSTHGSAQDENIDILNKAKNRVIEKYPQFKNNLDGELEVDAALVEDIYIKKAPTSCLEGKANILIFPSLDAGNIAYKLIERLGYYKAVGPIFQGLKKPSNNLSRDYSIEDILNVIKITCKQS